MAVYKVPQNVEAEDKLLGPFTLRQFIYLVIAAMGGFMMYGLAKVSTAVAIFPLPIVLVFGFLGVYRREDQPVEAYLMAFLSFMFKPRRRIWSPVGFEQTVVITAPKAMAQPQVVRDPAAVHGQLERLAKVIDTRGWSVKRPELQEPVADQHVISDDDRLIMPSQTLGSQDEPIDIHASDDILDADNNEVAERFETLSAQLDEQAKKAAIAKMHAVIEHPKIDHASTRVESGGAGNSYILKHDEPNLQTKPDASAILDKDQTNPLAEIL